MVPAEFGSYQMLKELAIEDLESKKRLDNTSSINDSSSFSREGGDIDTPQRELSKSN